MRGRLPIMNERLSPLILPIVVLYGLMILKVLARYFARVFGNQEEDDEFEPAASRITPPATELALASIVLDLSHIVGVLPSFTRMSVSMPSSSVAIVLPIVLIVFHCQLYVLSTLIERRLAVSRPHTPRRSHMVMMNLTFGSIAVFTNAATISCLLTTRGF
jgi:hypothetical protein